MARVKTFKKHWVDSGRIIVNGNENFSKDSGKPAIDRGLVESESVRVDAYGRVRDGLIAGEFSVAFQPIIHAQTWAVDTVECLLRWRHPQYGLLLPGAFDYAFESHEVAHEVTRFVLDTACRAISEQTRADCAPPFFAINIQPSQLLDDQLKDLIHEITGRYGIDPSILELELVESEEVLKLVVMQEFTAPLRSMGVKLSLDDFGTGYSSLATLALAHVDSVKLAREFLQSGALHPLSRTAWVVQTIIELVDKLELKMVVEGVETKEQLAWLEKYPKVYAQGYYVGRPVFDLACHALGSRHTAVRQASHRTAAG
jgi:EAL domain-containing protein (putative c-di-GMP-specific phosphodiesterase class I)